MSEEKSYATTNTKVKIYEGVKYLSVTAIQGLRRSETYEMYMYLAAVWNQHH